MGTAKAVGRTLIAALALSAVFSAGAQAAPGDLDPTFSGDGKQTTDFGFGVTDRANAVAIQANGRIVAAGFANGGATRNDFALARYRLNGSLDATFSGDGMRRSDFGFSSPSDMANGVAIQADGKIVAVGDAGGGATDVDFGLVRYHPDGSLDTGFSGDGKQRTDFGFAGFDGATAVAIQPDGKIVVVGLSDGGVATDFDFVLARYHPDGSLDTSFSDDGRRRTDFGGGSGDRANAVAIQPDGKIVVAGETDGQMALARYHPDGRLDQSFSGDGKQTFAVGAANDWTGVALQADGRIIAVGHAVDLHLNAFVVARYRLNGSLDPTFAGDGAQTIDFGPGHDRATGVAIQADGKIVVVGETEPFDFSIGRLNPTGVLDTTFSGDGKQTTSFGIDDRATGVAIQANGRIVVVGRAGVTLTNDDFAVARYFGG